MDYIGIFKTTYNMNDGIYFTNIGKELVSNQPEGTFACLRYSLGGDRPSQTTHQTLFPHRITVEG